MNGDAEDTMIAFIFALLIILGLDLQSSHAESANVSAGVSCGENGIGGFDMRIAGEIDSATIDKVTKAFDKLHKVNAAGGVTNIPARPGSSINCISFGAGYEINSPGGDVSAAMAIGRMFRKERAHIQVNRNDICISACVLILAGAVERLVSGAVGIHRPYLATTPQQTMTAEQVKEAYENMLQQIRSYLHEMNVSDRLADDMLATAPERVHIVTASELEKYGLTGVESNEQQRRAIENETRDIAEANQLGISRREYTRRKALGIESCIYNSRSGALLSDSEMLECRRSILTSGH